MSTKMQAICLKDAGGPEQLFLDEVAKPILNANEVMIKVAATALNRADTLQREGKYPPPKGASAILGLEAAGTICEVGSEVTKWQVGDKVCCLLGGGGYASFVNVHADHVMSIPPNLTFYEAAAIPEVFLTAYQALFAISHLKEGEKVLIHAGASGVGTAAIQLAKSVNAEVFVTASKPKHELCLSLGANVAIDYKSQQFDKEILEATDGKGVDVLVDFMAAPYLKPNINVLAVDGRMVLLALMGGIMAKELNMAKVLAKRLQITGSTLRARDVSYKKDLIKGFSKDFMPLFESGKLKPVIDSQMHWSEIVEAHQRMDANLNAGKIVLKVR